MTDGTLLVLQEGAEVHRLYLDSIVLGRSKGCDLSFDKQGVSRRHCEVVLRPDGVLVRDLGSTHGTFVDGNQVVGETLARVGAKVRLGPAGPKLRILDARLDGQPLGAGERSSTPEAAQPRPNQRTVPRTESAAPRPLPPRAPATTTNADGDARPPPGDRLWSGVALGAIAGVLLGLGLLTVIGMDAWWDAARDALGLR